MQCLRYPDQRRPRAYESQVYTLGCPPFAALALHIGYRYVRLVHGHGFRALKEQTICCRQRR